ncbi:hypothetical protein ACGFYZ_21395 [Streptomyces sp. NPDC048330]|uniref:hypothetical protein n=1 Tax=Streptomyces sp. NPDC048330 TaxID=3365533 RepID=UPI003722CD2F
MVPRRREGVVGPLGPAPPHQETARHGGHADIIRETIDGATLFPLPAAAERWPNPWFEPWQARVG